MPADAAPAFVWVPELAAAGERLELSEASSRYVSRVCRARPGEALTLTDGRGGRARTRIEAVGARVAARVESLERHERASRAMVICGAPEGSRADWMVEKLAELGVARFQPVHCERGRWKESEALLGRWRRLAVAALQQSQGVHLLELAPPRPLDAALGALPEGARMLAAIDGEALAGRVPGKDSVAAIGPSAGFAESERNLLLESGFRPISLSANRLRTETAALAWASWWAGGEARAAADGVS